MPPKKASQAKSKSKAAKKTKDEEIEEEEEEEEVKTTKRTTRQSASAKKQPSKGKKKDEEEDEEEESPKKTTKRGASKSATTKKQTKKGKKDEEEDEEEEEEKPKTSKRGAAKSATSKKQTKKSKEEDDEEEEEDEKPAPKRGTRSTRSQSAKEPKKAEPKKESPAKKPASKAAAKATTKQAAKDKKAADDDEKESEDEAPAQTTPAPKKEPAKKAPAKKKAAKKRDSGYSPWTDKSNKSYYNNRYGYGSYGYGGYGGYNRYNNDDDDDFIDDDEGKGRGRKGGRPKQDPNKDVDTDANIALDPEVVITNNIRVLALKGKPAYDYYDEEEDKSDPTVKKFFHMQILDNYQSTFPTHFFTFYRWGKAGEVGEWSLRGFFNRSRAIKIYDEKVEERKKYAKINDKKDTQNSQDQSQKDNTQPTQTTADTQVSQTAAEETQANQEEQKNGTQSPEKKNDGNIMEEEKQDQKKDAAEPVADQAMEVEKPVAAATNTAEQADTQTMEVEKQGEQAESKEQPKEGEKSASQKLDVTRIECPVDKYCVVKDETEVLIKDDEIFDVKYNVSDIQKNSNHFYCFQLLRSKKDPTRHYIFTRYGRVGLSGEWTLRGPFNEEQGIAAYRVKQNEKKEQNKYTALEMSYTKDDPEILTKAFQEAVGKSKLDKKVAEFIQLIFDFKMMNNQMAQAGYDTKKLPLGKLSLNMIEKGFSKLSELSEAIKNNAGEDVLAKLSSEFYTVIPQNIGWQNMKTMTIRDNKVITEKLEFLDSLRQIQIAYQMVYGLDQEANPIDTNYEKLKCDIEPLDQNSEEYKKIKEYIDNTKESYNVEIMEAFKINKHGAEEVFKKDLDNHVMLWHGSRLTNFVGILSQGLRIAPPEAPVSGYRLGKGIYLADMISKSVPYCYASGSNNTFCIMVCESALGNFNEKLRDDFYASNLPAGKHSTKALGHVAPPLSSYQDFAENVKIPQGKPEKTEHQSSAFMHNEYIVYDVNQVQIRYLLKMKQNSRGLFW